MRQHITLASMLIVIILLSFLIPFWLLPKLPPPSARGVCTTCHWDKKAIPAHQELNFTDQTCLRCHNPHSHFGEPYLPSIDSCMICHFEYQAKPGYSIHKPVREKQCESCHTRHKLFESSTMVVEQEMLCNSCHVDEMRLYDNPVGHLPYEKRQCLSCHEVHMAPEKALLRTPLTMLCQSCHRQEDEWGRPMQHMPFERGNCMDCHQPHASAWRGLTTQNQSILCYSCHFDRKDEIKRPVKHGPYGEGYCTDCHEPHSSNGPSLLPVEKEEEFCFLCHQGIHDVGWGDSPHNNLFDDDKVCLACHEHHSSNDKFLSRFPLDGKGNLCMFCHDRIGENYLLSGHAFLRCGQCHQIHGSINQNLLDAYELELCNRCHPGLVHTVTSHPVGEQYWDIQRDRAMLCTSCHGPHGTPSENMKVSPGNLLCISCHEEIK